MIQFKPDGPYGPPKKSKAPAQARFRVIGVGQAGIHVADQVVLHGRERIDVRVLDFDHESIEGAIAYEKQLLAFETAHGLGTGGDLVRGRELAHEVRAQLVRHIQETDYLAITVGLGAGAGGSLAEALVEQAGELGIKVLVLASLPFSFESRLRRDQARESLEKLRSQADAVLVFGNERLVALPDLKTNARQGFHLMNRIMAQTVEALHQILTKKGLIQLHFADVRSLFGRFGGLEVLENCRAGSASIEAGADPEDLVTALLDQPLFQGGQGMAGADHALLSITGGDELSLTQVQKLVKTLEARLPEGFSLAVGACSEPEAKARLSATLICATTQPVENVELPRTSDRQVKAAPASVRTEPLATDLALDDVPRRSGRKGRAKQEELPLESPGRGRFERSSPVIHKGEDLDQPTFRRRGLKVRV
jgi:cell division protein FtsZ